MGIFAGFLDDPGVILHVVEPLGAAGEPGRHAATLSFGTLGTLHGAQSIVLQQEDGASAQVSSVASGLVYPGVGPKIAMLHDQGRISVSAVSDDDVIDTFVRVSRSEGFIAALESCHALAFAIKLAAQSPSAKGILVNLSGRGDKDVDYVLFNYPAAFDRSPNPAAEI